MLAGALCQNVPVEAQLQRLFLDLRDGSVVTIEVGTEGFQWRSVTDGLEVETIPWQEFSRLTLNENSVGQQVTRIEDLLQKLESESYQEREAAEKSLRIANLSGPFKFVISAHMKKSRDAETLHRLRRVMNFLEDVDFETRPEFDRLTLQRTSGQTEPKARMGDALDFTIKGKFEGQSIEFNRQQIASVSSVLDIEPVSVKPGFSPVKTFNQIDRTVFNLDSELISFELNSSGNTIPTDKKLDNYFAGSGV